MLVQTSDENPDLAGQPPAEDPRPLLRALIAAWNARDVQALLDCFAADAVVRIVPPPATPQPELYRGRAEVKEWVGEQLATATAVRLGEVRMLGHVVTWDTLRELADGDTITNVSEAVIQDGRIVDFTP